MRILLIGAAMLAASVSVVLADDMPAAPAAPPADAATTTTTTTTTTSTTTTGDDPMAPTYGNTVIAKGAGPESHTHYNADHTFNGVAPEYNFAYQGTWEIKADGTLCRTFNPEVPTVSNPDCSPVPALHAVGDTVTTDKGATIALVAGLQ